MLKTEDGYEIYRDSDDKIITDNHFLRITEPHYHYCLEFMYVEKGILEADIQGIHVTAHPNQLVLVASYEIHSFNCPIVGNYRLLMIPRSLMKHNIDRFVSSTFAQKLIDDDENKSLLMLMKLIYNIANFKGVFSHNEDDNTIEYMCSAFIETVVSRAGLRQREPSTLLPVNVIQYLYSHFSEDISMNSLAKAFACNPQKLTEEFKAVFGITPIKYLGEIRASEVKRILLENPDMTLVEAADRCGFSNTQTLIRAFKRKFGKTPSEMKN